TQLMMRLQDGRTGKPLVKEVIRTRKSPLDDNLKLPDPDLVVVWHEIPTDVVDSPDIGRIGPVTLNRPGGHRADGFVMVKGPGVEAGSSVDAGRAVDLGPTILSLMNAPVPDYMDGKPLLQVTPERSTVGV
ncbi:MAG TPA: nucleotide pyrophosphatase, partial [Allocoleopsis sp.]